MFKVLVEGCEPKKATKLSAAVDLFAAEDVVITEGKTSKVRLGVCVDFPQHLKQSVPDFQKFLKSHYLQLEPRSSLRAKGLIAGTGIIDLDYKDEIMIILHNPMGVGQVRDCIANKVFYQISKGEKIAQIMLCEHKSYLMGYESEEERVGGFGSSGN